MSALTEYYRKQVGRNTLYIAGDDDNAATAYVEEPFTGYPYAGVSHKNEDIYTGKPLEGSHPDQLTLYGPEAHTPANIEYAQSTPRSHHLVMNLLSLAHKQYKGDISYSDMLSPYSAQLALHALNKGLVKEHPDRPREDLEQDVEYNKGQKYPRHGGDEASAIAWESLDEARDPREGHEVIPEHEVQGAKEHLRTLLGRPTQQAHISPQFTQGTLF